MDNKLSDRRVKFSIWYVLAMILVMSLVQAAVAYFFLDDQTEITYSDFKSSLRAGEVASVTVAGERISGVYDSGEPFFTIPVEDPELLAELEAHEVEIKGEVSGDGSLLTGILGWILPLALMAAFWYWMMGRMKRSTGSGSIFSIGKSKARVTKGEHTGVTFHDVGGAAEAIVELREVTEFLKNPERFQRLGGRMPKGVLLVGPPGTGKTLLARAAAGEAGVPFYSLSGSEFVEMFVGVGASRVRDLFEQAKKDAPSIIFIDEIDAIGGKRGGVAGMGSHEEREQTLNQLLAEMDGFEPNENVIVMAATNRPEVLDPALLRPGRFDRQIVVDLPDVIGREEILRIHAREVVLGPDVDLEVVARITPGFSGADLENLANQAALLAARREQEAVTMADFNEAIERVIAGSERRTRAMNAREKERVAYHEAGHALVASLLPGTDPVHKVTIVPRGRALGYTWQRPEEDRYLLSESELNDRLTVLLGGRVAEVLIFGEASTGAANDLERATDTARRMVAEYGLSPALGPVRLAAGEQAAYLGFQGGLDSRVSPQTASRVDNETRRLVEQAVERAWDLLDTHRGALEQLAQRLREEETVAGEDVMAILAGETPHADRQNGSGSGAKGPAHISIG
ncbi:MAG: ATP-dependent zinc metalloprotease FtsH [Anaerolineae bacterium]|nr:ATP-dependent zinc metalloprotease FtsH [Anaerolineae bacterium]